MHINAQPDEVSFDERFSRDILTKNFYSFMIFPISKTILVHIYTDSIYMIFAGKLQLDLIDFNLTCFDMDIKMCWIFFKRKYTI